MTTAFLNGFLAFIHSAAWLAGFLCAPMTISIFASLASLPFQRKGKEKP